MKIIVDNRSCMPGISAINLVAELYADGQQWPALFSDGCNRVTVVPISNKRSIRYLIQDAKS